MIICSEAARLISRSLDQPLTWKEKSMLGFHLVLCRLCRRYQLQLRWINWALTALFREERDGNR